MQRMKSNELSESLDYNQSKQGIAMNLNAKNWQLDNGEWMKVPKVGGKDEGVGMFRTCTKWFLQQIKNILYRKKSGFAR